MGEEINRLLRQGIIEKSISPWRSPPVIAKREEGDQVKLRLCIDYSRTVNKVTPEYAFPIPRIDEIVQKAATYRVLASFT